MLSFSKDPLPPGGSAGATVDYSDILNDLFAGNLKVAFSSSTDDEDDGGYMCAVTGKNFCMLQNEIACVLSDGRPILFVELGSKRQKYYGLFPYLFSPPEVFSEVGINFAEALQKCSAPHVQLVCYPHDPSQHLGEPVSAQDPRTVCAVCGATENLQSCGKCHVVRYCCKEHQVQDWPDHKQYCKLMLSDFERGKKQMSKRRRRKLTELIGVFLRGSWMPAIRAYLHQWNPEETWPQNGLLLINANCSMHQLVGCEEMPSPQTSMQKRQLLVQWLPAGEALDRLCDLVPKFLRRFHSRTAQNACEVAGAGVSGKFAGARVVFFPPCGETTEGPTDFPIDMAQHGFPVYARATAGPRKAEEQALRVLQEAAQFSGFPKKALRHSLLLHVDHPAQSHGGKHGAAVGLGAFSVNWESDSAHVPEPPAPPMSHKQTCWKFGCRKASQVEHQVPEMFKTVDRFVDSERS